MSSIFTPADVFLCTMLRVRVCVCVSVSIYVRALSKDATANSSAGLKERGANWAEVPSTVDNESISNQQEAYWRQL